jgi:hypothetical protein
MINYSDVLTITANVIVVVSVINLFLPFLILTASILQIRSDQNHIIVRVLMFVSIFSYLLLAISFIPYWTCVNYEQSFLTNRQPPAFKTYDGQIVIRAGLYINAIIVFFTFLINTLVAFIAKIKYKNFRYHIMHWLVYLVIIVILLFLSKFLDNRYLYIVV